MSFATCDALAGPLPMDHPSRPRFAAIVKRLSLSLLTANVVPSVLFYICLRASNIWVALIAALVWCYGAAAWRFTTKRRTSTLLRLSMIGLTAKTIFAFASGSTFFYFLQPAAIDALIAVLFMVSLTTARPVVAGLAADFFPMNADIAALPRIKRLFWHLTLLWAVLGLIKCVVTVWMLESMPTPEYVVVRSIFIMTVIIGGTALTVAASFVVARSEGLLHVAR